MPLVFLSSYPRPLTFPAFDVYALPNRDCHRRHVPIQTILPFFFFFFIRDFLYYPSTLYGYPDAVDLSQLIFLFILLPLRWSKFSVLVVWFIPLPTTFDTRAVVTASFFPTVQSTPLVTYTDTSNIEGDVVNVPPSVLPIRLMLGANFVHLFNSH